LSFNRWNYAQSDPINYSDPTGHDRCWKEDIATRVAFAEEHVPNRTQDILNTYTAAGIGVQCYGTNFNRDFNNSGIGPGQISRNQTATEYGKRIGTVDNPRGYGVRCWIDIAYKYTRSRFGTIISDDQPCLVLCLPRAQMKELDPNYEKHYQLEPIYNPNETRWAVEYMRRRIQMVVNTCKGNVDCDDTDKFIVAALAQNGPGFTVDNMDLSIKTNPLFRDNRKIDWKAYFPSQGNVDEFKFHLGLFYDIATQLGKDGYNLPNLDRGLIDDLRNGRYGP
jgi:hypothetical protein